MSKGFTCSNLGNVPCKFKLKYFHNGQEKLEWCLVLGFLNLLLYFNLILDFSGYET
jgi:hypothetical protein